MKNASLILSVLISVLILSGSEARAADSSKTQGADSIRVKLDFEEPELLRLKDGSVSVRGKGLTRLNSPGDPDLPAEVVRVALPPDTDMSSVRLAVKSSDPVFIKGPVNVVPQFPLLPADITHPPIWGRGRNIVDLHNIDVYSVDRAYPVNQAEIISTHSLRKWRWVDIVVYPCRYNPVKKVLSHTDSIEIEVIYSTRRLDEIDRAFLTDCSADERILSKVINRAQAAGWYGLQTRCTAAPGDPGFAIVTTNSIVESSSNLDAFIAHKESIGFNVSVYTEDDYDTVGGAYPNTRPERIREWLRQRYEDDEIDFVLLIGNPDPSRLESVPMKWCNTDPNNSMLPGAPTDSYYGNLTSNWDRNADGIFCDYYGPFGKPETGDSGEDGLDFTHEVYVGRIPVYNAYTEHMDVYLEKVMSYELGEGNLERRHHILIPASVLTTEGYQMGYPRFDGSDMTEKLIREDYVPQGLKVFKLYETTGVQASRHIPDLPIHEFNVVDTWKGKGGFGLVTWYGHGFPEGSVRTIWVEDTDNDGTTMDDWNEIASKLFIHTDYLPVIGSDIEPGIVFLGSCSNGEPEVPSNIGYNLIKHVAIASLPASRMSWGAVFVLGEEGWIESHDGDSFSMGAKFVRSLLEGGKTIGSAWADTLDQTLEPNGNAWYSKAEYNIQGDPSINYFQCTDDSHCDDGIFCNGAETCDEDGMCRLEPVDCSHLDDDCHKGVCSEERKECVAALTGPCEDEGDGSIEDSDASISPGNDAGAAALSSSSGGCSVVSAGSGCAASVSCIMILLVLFAATLVLMPGRS